MNELKLSEIACYLPYKLKICYRVLDLENGNPNTDNPEDRLKNYITEMTGARLDQCLLPETDRWYKKDAVFKPILRPITEIELQSLIVPYIYKKISVIDYISTSKKDSELNARLLLSGKYDWLELWKIHRLAEHHFDFQDLIGQGKAISIHEIKQST